MQAAQKKMFNKMHFLLALLRKSCYNVTVATNKNGALNASSTHKNVLQHANSTKQCV